MGAGGHAIAVLSRPAWGGCLPECGWRVPVTGAVVWTIEQSLNETGFLGTTVEDLMPLWVTF